MTTKRTRITSSLLAIAMFVTMLVTFISGANAAQYELQNLQAGQVVSVEFPSGLSGTMTGATTSDDTIAQYQSTTGKSASFLTKRNGTTTATINYTTPTGGTAFFTVDLKVGTSTTATNDSQTISLATVGSTQNGSYTYTNVTNLISSNPSVATASYNSATGYITVTAVGTGTANISGIGTRNGVQYNVIYTVNGGTAGTISSTGVSGVTVNGNMITMPVGTSNYILPTYYYTASVAANTQPGVATANISGTTGSQALQLSATTIGTTVVTLNVQTSAANTTITQVQYMVNVVAANTAAAGTTQTGTPLTVEAGKTVAITGYSEIQTATVKSNNTAVAIVTPATSSILVRGIAAGTTTITFQGKAIGSNVLTNYTVSVTVPGASSNATATTATNAPNITFPKESYSLSKSKKGKAYNMSRAAKLDGKTIDTNNVLWISTDTSVVSINSKTGQFRVLKNSGTARIIVVTKDGKNIGSVEIEAK